MIEVGKFGAQTAEVVPNTGQDGLDLFRRFFREGRRQVGAANPLFAGQGTDQAGGVAEKVGGLDRIEIARGSQKDGGRGSHHAIDHGPGRVANSGFGAKQQKFHWGQR